MAKTKRKKQPVDVQAIKQAANGRWSEIIQTLCHIPAEYLDGRHQPYPLCGGRDRWRVYKNFEETGGAA